MGKGLKGKDQDEHSNLNFPEEMTEKVWFGYWISMKKRTACPNTLRNYTERYRSCDYEKSL